MSSPDRALGYVRVSTAEQVRRHSLSAQEAEIRKYCVFKGFDLERIYRDEGVSAGIPLKNRPAGQKLSDELKAYDHVVAYKLDRLSRDALDCVSTLTRWTTRNISAHFCDLGGQAVDTTSATGRFMLTVLAAVAEMERGQIRERIISARALKRARGEYCGGDPQYGFSVDGGVLLINHEEMRATGLIESLHNRGLSLRAIAVELEQAGCRPRGTEWHPKTIRAIVKRTRGAYVY